MGHLTDKVAYLKGLAEGMKLSEDTNEHKLMLKMLEALQAFALEIEELREDHDELDEYVESMDEDLSDLEDYVFDDDEDDAFCDGCFDQDDDDDDDDDLVEYECPHCGCETQFDLTTFDFEDDYLCPECQQPFFSEDDDDNSDDDEEDEPLD
jgi:hypothetical protein